MSINSPLFKYTDSVYVDGFLSEGILRIGTLYDYRRKELGEAIGDASEGKKSLYAHNPKSLLVIDSDAGNHSAADYAGQLDIPIEAFEGSKSISIPDFMNDSVIRNGPNPGRFQWIVDGGGPVTREYEDKDCYIFSCANDFERNIMIEFGYDACIEIYDSAEFFMRISKSIRKLGKFDLVEHCSYMDRDIPHDSEYAAVRPSLIKELHYQYQKEVRGIWQASHKIIKPRMLKIGPLNDICKAKANPLRGSGGQAFAEKEFAKLILEYFGIAEADARFSSRASLGTTYHECERYRSLDFLWDDELVLSCRYQHQYLGGRLTEYHAMKKDSDWLTKYNKQRNSDRATQA